MVDPISQAPNDEAFLRLLSKHELGVRAFVRAGLWSEQDVDEVMQEVSLVAWRKFAELTDREAFGRWVCVIARYEVLKYRRTKARDRLVLDPGVIERVLSEGLDEEGLTHTRQQALSACLAQLPDARREFVLQAYSPGKPILALAKEAGKTPDAVYQMLSRIRRQLMSCVEKRVLAEGGV